MSTTPLYELESIDYAVTGWNGIVTANMQKMEAHLHSRFLVTLGETVTAGQAIYLNPDDGKAYKALAMADGIKQPALGLTVDPGDADEQIRVQRVGLVTGSGFLVGRMYYLSQDTAGALVPAVDLTVTGESFTAELQAYVSLDHAGLTPETETVTSADGATTYTRDTDYLIDCDQGRIMALSAGAMDAGAYLIGYDYSPVSMRPQLMGYAVSSTQMFIVCGLNDLALVHIEGNEQIGGVKTFSSLPRIKTYAVPTENEEFVTKKYVDDKSEAETDATNIAGIPVDATDLGDGKVLKYNAESEKLEYESLPGGSDAGSILGVVVNDAAKADGKILKYNAGTGKLEYSDDIGASGSGVTPAEAKKYAILFG